MAAGAVEEQPYAKMEKAEVFLATPVRLLHQALLREVGVVAPAELTVLSVLVVPKRGLPPTKFAPVGEGVEVLEALLVLLRELLGVAAEALVLPDQGAVRAIPELRQTRHLFAARLFLREATQ